MSDITIAILSLGGLCGVALWFGAWIGRHRAAAAVRRIGLLALLLMGGYLAFLWNRPVLAGLIPTSNLIILANWLPIWGSFFVGIYLTTGKVRLGRRVVIGMTALLLCAYSAIAPILGSGPEFSVSQPLRTDLQCQTTPYTCSAACAASLLEMHGIEATEREMAELCLTRRGTHWMGLFRGLKLKTKNTDWDVTVEPLQPGTAWKERSVPCVLSLSIDTSGFPAGIDHGFHPDCGHSVLYLGSLGDDCMTVFDPAPDFGVEVWDRRVLGCIEGGVAMRLVPRDPDCPAALRVTRSLATAMLRRQLTAGL